MTKVGDLVELMADAVEEGGSASDCLRKHAAEMNLTPDQIRLAARSYNVGTVSGHRKVAGILNSVPAIREKIDKAGSVDPEALITELFPERISTKSAVFHASAIDPVYNQPFTEPEHIQAEKAAERKVQTDKALDTLFNDVKAPKLAFHQEKVHLAPWNWLQVQKKALDKAIMEKTAAQDKAFRSMETLKNYFLATSPGEKVAWNDFRKRAELIFGDCVNPILNRIAGSMPRDMLKAAVRQDRSDATQGPYQLMRLTLDAFDVWDKAAKMVESATKKVEEANTKVPKGKRPGLMGAAGVSIMGTTKAALEKANKTAVMDLVQREDGIKMAIRRSEAAGGVPTKKRSSLLQLMSGELPDPAKKSKAAAFGPIFASTLGMGVGKEIGSHIPGAMPLEKMEDSAYNQLTDPAQEQELAGIRAESMLSGMINSDDVLSHQDPNTVISHYNELSQLVPNIMQQPAAARSILRQVVTTGGLTPYDIQQLQTMNQIGQRPAKAPSPGAA